MPCGGGNEEKEKLEKGGKLRMGIGTRPDDSGKCGHGKKKEKENLGKRKKRAVMADEPSDPRPLLAGAYCNR